MFFPIPLCKIVIGRSWDVDQFSVSSCVMCVYIPENWRHVPWTGTILKGKFNFQPSIFSGYVIFQGVFDENEGLSSKFHVWREFQLDSMGFCEMKFWNDTKNFWGDIFAKTLKNSYNFSYFYLANDSWVAPFHKEKLPKIYRNVHRRPIGHTKSCQFLRHRYGRNLVHFFFQYDLPGDSRRFSALVPS